MLRNLPIRWASKLKNGFTLCGCWEWEGANDARGYGKCKVFGRNMFAHRAIYEYAVGPICGGLVVHHLCYNRKCVNPFHLALCTFEENTKDSPNVHLFKSEYV